MVSGFSGTAGVVREGEFMEEGVDGRADEEGEKLNEGFPKLAPRLAPKLCGDPP